MSDTAQLIVLLIVSIVLTFVVGRLLVTAGEPFLFEVFQDKAVTRSVNMLLSVLFHLITLGVLAIITLVNIGHFQDQPLQSFVLRLGLVLLVLGIAYGISMLVLIRVRDQRKADEISDHITEKLAERNADARPADARPVDPRPVDPRPAAPQERPMTVEQFAAARQPDPPPQPASAGQASNDAAPQAAPAPPQAAPPQAASAPQGGAAQQAAPAASQSYPPPYVGSPTAQGGGQSPDEYRVPPR